MNALVSAPLAPPGFTTVTLTGPTATLFAGVVAEICDGPTTVTLVAGSRPNSTAAFGWKPVPVTVTMVPPALGPTFGVTPLTVSAPVTCVGVVGVVGVVVVVVVPLV